MKPVLANFCSFCQFLSIFRSFKSECRHFTADLKHFPQFYRHYLLFPLIFTPFLLFQEREQRKIDLETSWRPTITPLMQQTMASSSPQPIKIEEMEIIDDSNTKQATSPLLTSLLKSPSAAPNPSTSMLNTLPNQSRNTAPTITNLLTTGTVPCKIIFKLFRFSLMCFVLKSNFCCAFFQLLHNHPHRLALFFRHQFKINH